MSVSLPRLSRFLISACVCVSIARPTLAADGGDVREAPADSESYAIHAQATGVFQDHPPFAAPYSGANSLDPRSQHNETTDLTLFAGMRPWDGGELWVNPEVDQGFGLSNTVGAAGFVSAEAYKVGAHRPYFRVPRLFLRQTIDLGEATERVEADQNQLAGSRATDRVVVWAGKFAVVDVFDTNQYAHDPKNDFLNWSIVDIGSFDYAADAWGYTYGAAVEWTEDPWTVRGGLFNLSTTPNSKALDTRLFDQYQAIVELERRVTIADRPGKVRLLWFDSIGRMGGYEAAIAAARDSGLAPSTADVRGLHSKQGVGFNGEQQLADDLGVFLRGGWTQGKYEAFEFTDIDKTLSGGLALSGRRWGRSDDTVGVAFAVNGISEVAKRYFAAGGLGVLIGDGQLRDAAAEQIVEGYYSYSVISGVRFSIDYQFLNHPAYNADRGPVSVVAARAHVQF